MRLVDLNYEPTQRQLRQFGCIGLFGLPLVGWLFAGAPGLSAWESNDTFLVGGLAAVGLMMAVAAFARPSLMKPAFVLASIVAYPIGLVVSEAIVAVIYFVVLTPIGLALRLFGHNPLEQKIDKHAESYWCVKRQPQNVSTYFRQS